MLINSTRACDTGFVEISDNCSVKSALRSFSAHKRWVDKHLGKVYSLMNLLDKQFDRRSEEKCKELLSKSENQIAALLQYSEFLTQKKYEKEVDKLGADIEKVWDLFNKNAHKRSAAPAASPAATRRPPPVTDGQIKLVTELKPETLAHNATAGELRIWLKKFEAYYIASGMQNTRTAVQQAYLLNCLDSELSPLRLPCWDKTLVQLAYPKYLRINIRCCFSGRISSKCLNKQDKTNAHSLSS